MSFWLLLGIIAGTGAVGGLTSGFQVDRGFTMPQFIENDDRGRIWHPGFLGNMLTGAVAAVISWVLYGQSSQALIGTAGLPMTLSTMGAAFIVGLSGSGWLANAVGKNLLQAAASRAAAATSSPEMADKMLKATPADALNMANSMK